ncbi:MAG: hypothetical protein WAW16_00435 [Candidatus Cryosericum sp.]
MRPAPESTFAELEWVQPTWRRRAWELRSTGSTVGTMVMPGTFRQRAVATLSTGTLVFDLVGFWQRRATVDTEAGDRVADFESAWTGDGKLSIVEGPVFAWYTINRWRGEHAWMLEGREPLVSFRQQRGWKTGINANLIVDPAALPLPELPVLVTFGWYLWVLATYAAAAASSH